MDVYSEEIVENFVQCDIVELSDIKENTIFEVLDILVWDYIGRKIVVNFLFKVGILLGRMFGYIGYLIFVIFYFLQRCFY